MANPKRTAADEDIIQSLMGSLGAAPAQQIPLMLSGVKNPVTPPMPLNVKASVNSMANQTANTTGTTRRTGVSMSGKFLSPEEQQLENELRAKMTELADRSRQIGQAGIDDYTGAMGDYASADLGYNFAPLSALVEQATGVGGDVAKYLQASAPESADQKRQNLAAMKEKLQGMKGSLTKEEMAILKEQLDNLGDIKKYGMMAQLAGARSTGTDRRFDMRQLNDYGKQVKPLMSVNTALTAVEDALGFSLNEFNELDGTVRGERADAPGVAIPILGRINQGTPAARRFKATLSTLTNKILKENSGASVTTQEYARLLEQFSLGQFKLNTEAELLAALKNLGRSLENDIENVGAGYDPEIPSIYSEQQSSLRGSFTREAGGKKAGSPQNTPTDADIDNMTPAQLKEYLGK